MAHISHSSFVAPPPQSGGNALVTVLVTMSILLGMAAVALTMSRTDTIVSANSTDAAKAIWIAQAGSEEVKYWLEFNHRTGTFPHTITGSMTDGMYTTTVDRYPSVPQGKFRILSTATGPDGSTQSIREVVTLAGATIDIDAINIHGDGTHTKLSDGSSHPPPNFTIDSRNFDHHGALTAAGDPEHCPSSSAIAGDPTELNNHILPEINDLRCRIVKDANGKCTSSTNPNQGQCNPNLFWIRGSDTTPRFNVPANCAVNATDPKGFHLLNLSAPEMRWSTGVASLTVPVPTMNLDANRTAAYAGPVAFDTDPDTYAVPPPVGVPAPLVRELSVADKNNLNATIEQILTHALNTPIEDRRCITGNLSGVTVQYGNWNDAKVTIVADPNHGNPKMVALSNQPPCNGQSGNAHLDIDGGARIEGTGILIVPRELRIAGNNSGQTRFHWRGIVVILEGGKIIVKTGGTQNACGIILGGLILKDNAGNNPKINLLNVGATTCPNPLCYDDSTAPGATNQCPGSDAASPRTTFGMGVKYSCAAIDRALGGSPKTVAWVQDFAGE